MPCLQDAPRGGVLASKPSTSSSFKSNLTYASATSAGSVRSGGSKLLFGEIDMSTSRVGSFASICNLVQCDSSKFARFWLADRCRETVLSYLSAGDLKNLRRVCHDFGEKAAPWLFTDLKVDFNASAFRDSRLADLHRIAHLGKSFRFSLPHSDQIFLPPLIDETTGEQLEFHYTPQLKPATMKEPRFGTTETTMLLTRQWPPLFHAATNIPSFIRAFSALVNVNQIIVHCPGYQPSRYRQDSIIDYALISIRLAIEQNLLKDSCNLKALTTLCLRSLSARELFHMDPLKGVGATIMSRKLWLPIQHLYVELEHDTQTWQREDDQRWLIHSTLTAFTEIKTLDFRWAHGKGPMPFAPLTPSTRARPRQLFSKLEYARLVNLRTTDHDIIAFVRGHRSTEIGVDLDYVDLTKGRWSQFFPDQDFPEPRRRESSRCSIRSGDIPIMLSPTILHATPPGIPDLAPLDEVADMERATHASLTASDRQIACADPVAPGVPPTPTKPVALVEPIASSAPTEDGDQSERHVHPAFRTRPTAKHEESKPETPTTPIASPEMFYRAAPQNSEESPAPSSRERQSVERHGVQVDDRPTEPAKCAKALDQAPLAPRKVSWEDEREETRAVHTRRSSRRRARPSAEIEDEEVLSTQARRCPSRRARPTIESGSEQLAPDKFQRRRSRRAVPSTEIKRPERPNAESSPLLGQPRIGSDQEVDAAEVQLLLPSTRYQPPGRSKPTAIAPGPPLTHGPTLAQGPTLLQALTFNPMQAPKASPCLRQRNRLSCVADRLRRKLLETAEKDVLRLLGFRESQFAREHEGWEARLRS